MSRSRASEAIVIKTNRIGEIHKGVLLLTPREGLVRAIAHGAFSQKGKLRGLTDFLCSGTAYLYHNPVSDSTKLSDFDVRLFHSRVREDLARFYTASLWAEAIAKTHGAGGGSEELFALFHDALAELERRPGEEAQLVSVQFVWRFLSISGMQPDLEHCAITGEFLAEGEPVYYSPADQGFCNRDVAIEHMAAWQPGALAFMRHTAAVPLAQALRTTPPAGAAARIKRVLYAILEEHVDSPLNTLKSGGAIL
ncbi:MAG: DNA repair protein RecO [Spirochaetales bacterium]